MGFAWSTRELNIQLWFQVSLDFLTLWFQEMKPGLQGRVADYNLASTTSTV